MRPASIFRLSAVRLALTFAGLLALVVAAVFGLLYWQLTSDLEDQLQVRVLERINFLIANAEKHGLPRLIEVIENEAKAVRLEDAIYLLTDASGTKLAGNIDSAPEFPQWGTLAGADLPGAASAAAHETYMSIWSEKPWGHLLVGMSARDSQDAKASLWDAMMLGLSATVGLAFAIGGLAAWRAQRRIDAIAGTLNSISHGKLSARVAVTGQGDDLDRVSVNLNRTLDRLESAIERVNQTSSDIAHDLKKPIGRLRQRIESLARRADDRLQDDLLESLAEVDNIVGTFDALLSIAQIESGAQRERFADIDLEALVKEVVGIYRPVAEDTNHLIAPLPMSGTLPNIRGDKDLLVQLFANLIENAIQHCPSGTNIFVSVRRGRGRFLEAEVTDRGSGIPADEREKVFNRLYRLDKSRTTPGNGLGLAIVAAIAELHDAQVRLEDNNPGLRVIISFPVSA